MKKGLVIVESPAKIKTIQKYLGSDFEVAASMGHIIDLPKKKFGVDIQNDFELQYEVIPGKEKVIKDIVNRAKKIKDIYLGTDPDREGEAISWHIFEELQKVYGKNDKNYHRVLFKELTQKGINEAINAPTKLNENLYDAQKARRALDRIVGYELSPLLWEKVKIGLSAGRVQSVALRLICEREREIRNFIPEEYWTIQVKLEANLPPQFLAKLAYKNGKKIEIKNEDEASKIIEELKQSEFIVKKTQRKEKKKNPQPPFITSTLQQEAARKLNFSAQKTMSLAQRLYEGVEIGEEGPVGLITYMRTDSTRLSDEAINSAREFILNKFGEKFLPEKPNTFKTKSNVQDAHEAIRPTSVFRTPEDVKQYLDKDLYKLYELIWKRFVACQMAPAVYDQTIIDIEAGDYLLRASGSILKFEGFSILYLEGKDEERKREDEVDSEEELLLPPLNEGEKLQPKEFIPKQHFTQPPPRYTEASLVKALEEKGIGRPSTYATIMSNIRQREYVQMVDKHFVPTELGFIVSDLLVKNFPRIMDVGFTSEMEKELDEIEVGSKNWKTILREFYETFKKELEDAKENMESIKAKGVETDIKCSSCEGKLHIRFGKNGEFLACSNYPTCKTTFDFTRDEQGKIVILDKNKEGQATNEVCDKCGAPMVIKKGKYGEFLSCSKYPECKNLKQLDTTSDIPCPVENCDGFLLKKMHKKTKRFFYGCNKFPDCTFATWDEPINENCPQCNSKILLKKVKKKETTIYCPHKDCNYKVSYQNT